MLERRGLIIARHRRELIVEDESGSVWSGLVRGRRLKPLVGDEVRFGIAEDGTPVVEGICERRTLLERIDSRGLPEGIAANVSLLVVVVAPEPAPDWQLVDRYLVAAALLGIDATIILNKCDLAGGSPDPHPGIYEGIGYRLFRTSAATGEGLAELSRLLGQHRGVLVGQSGVGKSSLLNALVESAAQTVQSLSHRRALGRHTTTAAVLHRLPDGGELIDSPGVRRYAPPVPDSTQIDSGFIEFAPLLGQCRFNDCRHDVEPGCAIQNAIAGGSIDPERHRSYLALRETIEKLR